MGRHGRFVAVLAGVAMATAGMVVLAAPSGATVYTNVTTEAGLRTAWGDANATEVDLGSDIVLGSGGGCGVVTRISTTPVTLNGNGHTITQTCASGGVLDQESTGALTIQNVTITGGNAPSSGGGIEAAAADITLTNSTISGNKVTSIGGEGGGIEESSGNVTVTNSTISGNTVTGDGGSEGGGIRESGGNVTVTNSTISGNTVTGAGGPEGGGIRESGGNVTVTNSTISGNTVTGAGGPEGGGIRESGGNVTVTNSTISGNTASGTDGPEGGGIRESGGSVTFVYATVVQNSAPDAQVSSDSSLASFASVVALPAGGGANCTGVTTTSKGFNFSDDASCGFAIATDKQNAGNPGLGPLANNGGPTQTMLPQDGPSPLIDGVAAGSCQVDGASGITTDQRGLPRPDPASPNCDIGAVEVQPASAAAPTLTVAFTG